MSQENVEIVREQFKATSRREFAVTYLGRDVVGEFFSQWFRAFGDIHFDVLETRSSGDAVAVAARHRARGRHSDIEVSDTFFYEYRLRHGKVLRIKFHNSWAKALEAVGLRE